MKRYTLFTTLTLMALLVLAGCSSSHAAAPPTVTPMPQTAGQAIGLLTDLGDAVQRVYAKALATATPAPETATPTTPPAVRPADVLTALQATLENIYTQVNPSVVNIRVVQKVEGLSEAFPGIPGFPGFPSSPQQPAPEEPQYSQGAGSGFVWDKEGHIVTNNHVVEGADKIEVTFYDGTTVQAEIVGADPDSDLAVVKVDVPADGLLPVQLADSTQVKVGQLAVAIGNPFGLEGTMTVGFVSAVGRSLPVTEDSSQGPRYTIPDIIQTDAPINPGNSGGVLVDDQGLLIGVTAAIESPVRANAGIGFAIPSVVVENVVPVLIEAGHYDHPWLGISGTDMTPDLAETMGLEGDQRGALVVEVVPGGPSDKGGLQGSDRNAEIYGQQVQVGGDVIVAINDQSVNEFDDVVVYLARHTEVGQTVTLTVLRQGEEEKVQVTLEARPAAEAQRPPVEAGENRGAWLGITGLTVTPDIAAAMKLPSNQQGVLIAQVVQGSPADEAGLRGSDEPVTINGQELLIGGDVVMAMDGQAVQQIEDLRTLVGQAQPGQAVTLTLIRDGEQIEVPVTLGERPETTP